MKSAVEVKMCHLKDVEKGDVIEVPGVEWREVFAVGDSLVGAYQDADPDYDRHTAPPEPSSGWAGPWGPYSHVVCGSAPNGDMTVAVLYLDSDDDYPTTWCGYIDLEWQPVNILVPATGPATVTPTPRPDTNAAAPSPPRMNPTDAYAFITKTAADESVDLGTNAAHAAVLELAGNWQMNLHADGFGLPDMLSDMRYTADMLTAWARDAEQAATATP